jgi:hypothetical protein
VRVVHPPTHEVEEFRVNKPVVAQRDRQRVALQWVRIRDERIAPVL